ncbi:MULTISPECIES: flagellar biosynthetic protein FliR [Methylotenera]|uniref:flagellar biosynthetic protein FliR n=1 Tax=Methylotenera TaxID=359407 RepID=UPI0003635962|nr:MULTISPECIES: flagellar biosynthetic protein FliR [Methylotenera]
MISLSSDILQSWISGLLWPLTRVLAVLAAAPLLSNRVIPLRVKLGFGLLLTMIIVPTLPSLPQVDVISLTGLLILVQQIIIGTAIGFSLRIFLAAVELAGQLCSLTMGLGFASFFDPASGGQSTSISQFFGLLAMLVFLSMNGHLMLISAMLESFHTLPISADGLTHINGMTMAMWASNIFSAGLMMAMPVVAALLITNMALGILTRTAPQLNLFGIGFPITIGMGFLIIALSLPGMLKPMQHLINESFSFLSSISSPSPGKP